MGQIKLNGMKYYAYHGCYPEEQLTGNWFLVNLVLDTDMEKASKSDDIQDALNYVEVCELVKQEMNVTSHLLEHVCARILDSLFVHFPQLEQIEVEVAKLNPPVGGQIESVSVSQRKTRQNRHNL